MPELFLEDVLSPTGFCSISSFAVALIVSV